MVSSILGSRESAWSSRTRRAELLRKGIITRRRKGAKVWLRQAVLLCGKWCRPSWARVSRPGPVERGGQNYHAKVIITQRRKGAKAWVNDVRDVRKDCQACSGGLRG